MDRVLIYAATGDAVARVDIGDGEADVSLSLEGSGAQCVAVDRDRVFAGTLNDGLHRSLDGGSTWEPASDAIPHPRVLAVAVSVADGSVLAGTEPSLVCRSDDDGDTWETFPSMLELPSASTWSFPPRPWTHHVRWIAPHRTDPQTWHVGIELGGVLRTADGGATWEDRHADACIDPHVIRTHARRHERVYEVAGDGVAWSADGGGSWTRDTDGMDRTYAWGLAVDPVDPDLWYVSSAPGPGHAHSGNGDAQARLWRKRGSERWAPLAIEGDAGPLDRMPYSLLTVPDRPGWLVVGFDDGRIVVSREAGESWTDPGVKLPGLVQLACTGA